MPFADVSCTTHQSANWTDVTATASGVTLTEPISGLSEGTLYRWRARVLYASDSVTQPGITTPPLPAHGPWRRLSGQAIEADIATEDDADLDGVGDPIDNCPGLANPLQEDLDGLQEDLEGDGEGDACDLDIDGDGLSNADETAIHLTDPQDAGDDCQCGDVDGDNAVTALDLAIARENLVGATLSGSFDAEHCDYAGGADCGVDDMFILDRILQGKETLLINACPVYGGP
jgi:hypothetical protein